MADSYKIDLTVSADLRVNVCCSVTWLASQHPVDAPRNHPGTKC